MTIRERGQTSVVDAVTQNATGFTSTASPGNGGTSLGTRGFIGHGSVMQLYDGTRMYVGAETLTFPFDTWSAARIEVLRGPASSSTARAPSAASSTSCRRSRRITSRTRPRLPTAPMQPKGSASARVDRSASTRLSHRCKRDAVGRVVGSGRRFQRTRIIGSRELPPDARFEVHDFPRLRRSVADAVQRHAADQRRYT